MAGNDKQNTYYITSKCQSGNCNILRLDFSGAGSQVGIDGTTIVTVLLWFLAQCVLYVSGVGGNQEKGVILQSGEQLIYNTNVVLGINVVLMAAAILLGFDVTHVSGSLTSIFKSAVLLCFTFSVYFYVHGAGARHLQKNPNGCSGNVIYDWFMGRELNPRWRSLDVKYVVFRSCLIGWVLINLCSLVESWTLYRNINTTLLLLDAMQFAYIIDYFWFERGAVVCRDIVHEGLGYNVLMQFIMIPFCSCVQTRYVVTTNTRLSSAALCIIALTYAVGYYTCIYRASNSEKNDFRRNPSDPELKHLRSMSTASGNKLLISGWWGMCRHPNYLGDMIIFLSYALCTGFSHLIPYLGIIFLVLLLLDREKEDSEDCRRKYGDDWDKYCRIVKYRIIPGIY